MQYRGNTFSAFERVHNRPSSHAFISVSKILSKADSLKGEVHSTRTYASGSFLKFLLGISQYLQKLFYCSIQLVRLIQVAPNALPSLWNLFLKIILVLCTQTLNFCLSSVSDNLFYIYNKKKNGIDE